MKSRKKYLIESIRKLQEKLSEIELENTELKNNKDKLNNNIDNYKLNEYKLKNNILILEAQIKSLETSKPEIDRIID